MDILDEIREGLKKPGKSKKGLARALGREPSAVTALFGSGKNGKPRQVKATEIPVIRAYFASEEVDSDEDHVESSDIARGYQDRPTDGIMEIDVRAGLGGGGSLEGREVRHDGDYADPVKSESWKFPARFMREEIRASESQVVILETDGDSMEPTIGSGERVIVHTGMRMPSPDGIFALRDRFGNIIAKRLQVLRSGDPPRVLIISDNKAHAPEEVGLDEITIVGRVLWGLKRL